ILGHEPLRTDSYADRTDSYTDRHRRRIQRRCGRAGGHTSDWKVEIAETARCGNGPGAGLIRVPGKDRWNLRAGFPVSIRESDDAFQREDSCALDMIAVQKRLRKFHLRFYPHQVLLFFAAYPSRKPFNHPAELENVACLSSLSGKVLEPRQR